MAIDDTVKSLFNDYFRLKNTRDSFENNPNPDNVQARSGIIQDDGAPAFEVQAGTAGAILGERTRENLAELEPYFDGPKYKDYKVEFFDPLSDQGKAVAYSNVIVDSPEVRGALNNAAIRRVAAKYKLADKLAEADPTFSAKPDADKIRAYDKAINSDKAMKTDFIKDASVQASNSLALADNIETLLAKGRVEDAIDLVNQSLGVSLAVLYKNAGQIASAKAIVEKTAVRQREYAIKLMAENSYVINDVEKALGDTLGGYARAAAEVYSVYNSGPENKFRSDYAKARTEGKVANLADFRRKAKEAAGKHPLKKAA